ncbi:MAG TPA: UBP-type zinc finger domain-containing protein [Galbitalea sp.]
MSSPATPEVSALPSGVGCEECDETDGWWLHLRRCVECGHVGCCDSSPSQHGTAHYMATGHAIMRSFEPGEDWFWDYSVGATTDPVSVSEPLSHPSEQTVPGPSERVPANWQELLH